MPQLDSLTFVTQIFWVLVLFFTFYAIFLNTVIPSVGKIIKIRRKKIEFENSQSSKLNDEEEIIRSEYEGLLVKSLIESRQLLSETIKSSLKWYNDSIETTNKTILLNVNKQYLQSIVDLTSKKYLITAPLENIYTFKK